jgi:hypothetical protein
MKIVCCLNIQDADHSNGVLAMVKMVSELAARGLDVRVCITESGGQEDVPVEIRELFTRKEYYLNPSIRGFLKRVFKIIQKYNITLCDSNDFINKEDIVIYPEVVLTNPLNASKIVRFFGNRELYIKSAPILKDVPYFSIAHSRLTHPDPDHILFFAEIDPNFLSLEVTPLNSRTIDLTYVGKGSLYLKSTEIIGESVGLGRQWPQSKRELAYLLRRTRLFYTYDIFSNINVEAVLSGALPVYLCNRPYSDQELDSSELGEIPRIKYGKSTQSIDIKEYNLWRIEFLERVQNAIEAYPIAIDSLIEKLETRFGNLKVDNNSLDQNGSPLNSLFLKHIEILK